VGKGGVVAKDLQQINHLTNASIRVLNGNNPKELNTNVGII
jgi:hypothetical protein